MKTIFALPILALVFGLGLSTQRANAAEIIVAGGCFWCVESDFESLRGVREVVSGYTGGTTQNPTYKQVTRGGTGHYEAVRIIYNGSQQTPAKLYDLFFRSIDPTDARGQFCDRGTSYRSAIFVTSAAQRKAAEAAKAKAEAALGREIVTPILDAKPFYQAEDYHQDYYKGTKRVLTRFGRISQADAYKRYRKACGRDKRVKQIWGAQAAFTN